MKAVSKFLSLVALFVCVSASAMACEPALSPPVIRIDVLETLVAFDVSLSAEDLGRMDIDTVSPYPSSYHADVKGVMRGDVSVEHNIGFHRETLGEKSCVSLKEINVTIKVSPTIYIASGFQDQACQFKQVFIHEAKHLGIDKALMDKYAAQFTGGLNLVLSGPADYSSGWVDVSVLDRAQDEMQRDVEAALEVLFGKMIAERLEKQQELDSIHEYRNITRACQEASS